MTCGILARRNLCTDTWLLPASIHSDDIRGIASPLPRPSLVKYAIALPGSGRVSPALIPIASIATRTPITSIAAMTASASSVAPIAAAVPVAPVAIPSIASLAAIIS